jgi:hypothetical protein
MPSWRCAFPVELRGSAAPTRSAAGANDEALGGGDLPVEVPRVEFHSPGRLVDAAQLRDGERLYTEGRRQRRVLQLGPGGPVSGHSKAPVPQINGDRAQSSTSIARADPSGQPHPAGTSDPLSVQRSYFEPLASDHKPGPRENSPRPLSDPPSQAENLPISSRPPSGPFPGIQLIQHHLRCVCSGMRVQCEPSQPRQSSRCPDPVPAVVLIST